MVKATTDAKEAKPKKRRTKRATWVLQNLEDDAEMYRCLSGPFASGADATKWIRENGKALAGQTISIAAITPPRKVEVETKSVVKF